MTTLTLTLESVCTGGNHLTFVVTGARTAGATVDIASISEPLDEQDLESFIKVIAKMATNGRTKVQARNLLQAGVTVTV